MLASVSPTTKIGFPMDDTRLQNLQRHLSKNDNLKRNSFELVLALALAHRPTAYGLSFLVFPCGTNKLCIMSRWFRRIPFRSGNTGNTRSSMRTTPADCTIGADARAVPVRRLPGGTVHPSDAIYDDLIQLTPAYAQGCGCTGQAPLPLLGLWNT
jgi:hypothetical protein